MGTYLDKINDLNDIKKLNIKELPELGTEIREFILDKVSKNGGHLASNLGAVELTMALHYVLDLPKDKIVWDVGHQAYTHKILSGRKKGFDNLRQLDGLSGFPKKHESPADVFETGHSSTSISAALGMASAAQISGSDETVVAVIGDGALTGGMALEALNNVSSLKRNFIIILNDNKMSISENVGAMSRYLNKFRVGTHYNDFKEDVEHSLRKIPKIGNRTVKKVKGLKDHIKNLFVDSNFFDDLGITYIGPINGHDINNLIHILEQAKKIDHPILLHVNTLKGKGYKFAEETPSIYHGVSPFDKSEGVKSKISGESFTDVFANKLVEMAKEDKKICAITAAMPDGTGLSKFEKKYPKRFFDVGIAEEHGVTFAAGLASSGLKPYISIYSSFYQRAFDQILHDVCLQKLPVRLICDRAGLVGNDGETHQGIFDIPFMSMIPNMTIISPANKIELINALEFSKDFQGPLAIRYPRGTALEGDSSAFEYGRSEIITKGEKVAIITVGTMLEEAMAAVEKLKTEGINVALINARFVKPLDTKLLDDVKAKYSHIITVEESLISGGFGQQVESYIGNGTVTIMGIEDKFVEQGSIKELRKRLKIDSESIYKKVKELI